MKKYQVSIELITPYMQHRMDTMTLKEWEKVRGPIIENAQANTSDEVKALFVSYVREDGTFFMPVEHIRQACINAGTMTKAKVGNARKSMTNIVAGMFFFSPEEINIPGWDQIDVRSAVNGNIKGRVVVYRPRWNELKVSFVISVDNDTITPDTVQQIVTDAGNYIGIGSYRPQHKGNFGRYKVTEFKTL